MQCAVMFLSSLAEWRSYCFDLNNTFLSVYQSYWRQLCPSLSIQVIILILPLWFVLLLLSVLAFANHT